MKFEDYYEFVYLNSHLTRREALEVSNYAWNKGYDKYQALQYARELGKEKEQEEEDELNRRGKW